MKKIYFLCLLFCMSLAAKAQFTDTIYASGLIGSYTTGSVFKTLATTPTYSRNDRVIAVTNSTITGAQVQTGYAVFNLSSIPTAAMGAVVSRVILGVNRFGFTGSPGIFGPCVTYGNPTNFAAITNAATLFADCQGGGGGTMLWDATTATADGSYGSYVNDTTMIATTTPAVSAPVCTWIQGQLGNPTVSISFNVTTASTSYVYNFTGEDGVLDTGGLHAPYLLITYCYNPTGVTATASPTTLCEGATLTLSGTASGASSYVWNGPDGYTSTMLNPAFTVTTTASSGVYTLTANTLCGTFTRSVTAAVTVNSSPTAITTATTTVCQGNIINMSDATHGGVWSSSNSSIATVDGLGDVTGVNGGTAQISFTLGACPAIANVTVNDPPGPISGPGAVCASGGTIILVDGVTGGTWTSSNSTLATVDPVSGTVTGITFGSVTISYYTGACNTVTYPVTINPLPTGILGAAVVCVNATLPLSDATAGGTWSSDNTSVATVDVNLGIVTGVTAATTTITYTLPTGCYITTPITVNPIPAVVAGPTAVCLGSAVTLSDATGGGTWTSSNTLIATVGSTSGVVSGVSANGVNITYTLPVTGCYITDPFTVNPLPNTITGPAPLAVCVQATISLSDATPAGTWSSQLTSIATVDPVAGTVTGVAAGLSLITYTISATGCYKSTSVTVNPLPAAVITPAGPTTFCAGGSVVLNASVAGGDTYVWFSNSAAIPGANTSSITVNTTEAITVQVTDGNGCINTSTVTQVTLVQAAVIVAGGPVVFCQTGNVELTVPLAPGLLYQWTLNGTNISGANTNIWYATLNGTYTCNLDVPGGCTSTTPAFVVTVHPSPDPIVTSSGTQLSTTNSFLTYQWYLNSVAIPGATTTVVTPAVNGNYIVRVTDGNGCTGYSVGYLVDDLGVEQINKTDIKIYPNPANSIVHILSPVTVRAIITDIAGKTLLEVTDAKDIDISSFPDGIYMIMLYDNNGDRLVIRKLVKE